MKYNYKKQMFFIECGVLYVFCCLISFALFYFFGEEREDYYEIAIEGAIVVVVFMMIFQKEYANRYVEFYKESIRFNSFRIAKIRKVMSFNLRYENITSIEASYLPVFGVWKIKVSAKGFAYPIPISFCFNKYTELCEKLCGLVEEHNPDVYIDGNISNFIERKKRHEGN